MKEFKHIILNGRTNALPYSTYGGGNFPKRNIENRKEHGRRIKSLFENAIDDFGEKHDNQDFVYVEFESAINFELDLAKFQNKNNDLRLASCKRVSDDSENLFFRVAVFLNKKAISSFLNKLDQYIDEDTTKGNPKHQSLVANIEGIKAATLRSFWYDSEALFPAINENKWWELWIERINEETTINEDLKKSLTDAGIQQNNRTLVFPDHLVTLIKGTASDLEVLLHSDQLAELRKPLVTADFFTSLEVEEQEEFIEELIQRTEKIKNSNISVSLLDSGVNRSNILLSNFIEEKNLDTINLSWGTNDSFRSGHGTPMAGLILFGDLSETFDSSDRVKIYHELESIKIIHNSEANDPELFGKVTQEAIARAEILNPDNKRIVCLAVTAPENNHVGQPSSWSSAIDQTLFGSVEERNDKTLVVVSAGNIELEQRLTYPLSNDEASINDPAQSFNAITVGSYTLKDNYDFLSYPSAELLAKRGGLSPCSSTSVMWDKYWARKPDIVMEGGNDGMYQDGIFDTDSLKLLSTAKGSLNNAPLTTFGDTSASTALAAKLVSELYYAYPNLAPETIRGLVIHSADWTSEMLSNKELSKLSSEEKSKIIQRVGYGVPDMIKAKNSANNSLTLIAERGFYPYKFEDSRVKTNEFHLLELPWPKDVLLELAESQVQLKVTLSYFIEPNPGNKAYTNAKSYASHGLRFKIIDRNESEINFKSRISKAIKDQQEDYESEGTENWILGSNVRDKGSIHKDIWKGNAADLALRNKIAIFPVGGWWKTRKYKERYSEIVKYSLIVSIETPDEDIDIYTPVLNQIDVDINI